MKFREHRGGLAESMTTVIELEGTRAALTEHIRQLLLLYPTAPEVSADALTVEPYIYDERIRWDTHLVWLKGYGVVGYTDGPVS